MGRRGSRLAGANSGCKALVILCMCCECFCMAANAFDEDSVSGPSAQAFASCRLGAQAMGAPPAMPSARIRYPPQQMLVGA